MMLHDALIDQFVPRTYPFANLWGAEATAKNVCETLPDDSDIIRYASLTCQFLVLKTATLGI